MSSLSHDRLKPSFLLDTNVISATARKRPPAGLKTWLAELGAIGDLCLCFPVMSEVRRGLVLCQDPEQTRRIEQMLDDIENSGFLHLKPRRDTERIYASMMATPALKHFWFPPSATKHWRINHDPMIAAIAITHEAIIITSDTDFKFIDRYFPLPGVYDPLLETWSVQPAEPINLPELRKADCEPLPIGMGCVPG